MKNTYSTITIDDKMFKKSCVDFLAELYEDEVEAKKVLKTQMMALELVERGFTWRDI